MSRKLEELVTVVVIIHNIDKRKFSGKTMRLIGQSLCVNTVGVA